MGGNDRSRGNALGVDEEAATDIATASHRAYAEGAMQAGMERRATLGRSMIADVVEIQ